MFRRLCILSLVHNNILGSQREGAFTCVLVFGNYLFPRAHWGQCCSWVAVTQVYDSKHLPAVPAWWWKACPSPKCSAILFTWWHEGNNWSKARRVEAKAILHVVYTKKVCLVKCQLNWAFVVFICLIWHSSPRLPHNYNSTTGLKLSVANGPPPGTSPEVGPHGC